MALDMYCYQTKNYILQADPEFSSFDEICKWKNHETLHKWMERLYFQKGGIKSSFNCQSLLLLPQDVQSLENAVLNKFFLIPNKLISTEYSDELQKNDMIKIIEIKIAISKGFNVYYTSWR